MSMKRLFLSVFIVLCTIFLTSMSGVASDTGSVKGKLHKNSASGSALSGAKVTCGGESDKTDDDGKFKIKGIKKGEHTIKFSKDGYESYQTTVKIKAGETANVGDRWLTKESSSQTSTTAKCPSGNGLYCGDSGKGQNTGYLYQCTNGAYSLQTSCSNGCQKNAAGINDSCKAATASMAGTASNTGSVSGILHKNSASGTPLSEVLVKCSGKSGTTDKDTGKFKLQGIAAGNQTISFSKQGYETYSTTVTIKAGFTANMGNKWLTEIVSTGRVAGAMTDKVKPVVNSFNLNKTKMAVNDTVTISYTVSDSTGLKQVELWRSTNNKDWTEIANKRQYLAGKTKASGVFTDSPSSAGTYYYGIHVVDIDNNWDSEGGSKKLDVINPGNASDTFKPTGSCNFSGSVKASYFVPSSLQSCGLAYGKLNSNVGEYHTGQDIAASAGQPVYSVCLGKVKLNNTHRDYGNPSDNYWNSFLIIEHDCNGDGKKDIVGYYGHITSNLSDNPRDTSNTVTKGEEIGKIREAYPCKIFDKGKKRCTSWYRDPSSDHLHFGINEGYITNNWGYLPNRNDIERKNWIDPVKYFNFK